ELIEDVRVRGDDAVCEALARHDGVTVRPDELRLDPDEIVAARVDAAVDEAIDDAIDHVRRFNERQLQQLAAWEFESEPGLVVGEKLTPISSVGVFVPSGKASYPSVAYQLAVPAVVAGVPEIVLVVPPIPGGGGAVDPAVLVVCAKLGITDVFRVNGPAGIAALGFGTEHIPAVRKVVGPGSPPVTLAQVEMQRHGLATVMLLGPTESLVIADATADPRRLAADLLIEAEHGTDSSVLLVTLDAALAADVDGELASRLAELPPQRAEAATAALGVNGGCVVVSSLAEAIEVANAYAPEHLQLAIRADDVERAVDGVHHAGEILVGQDTPFSAANFVIGCPASLPTSGFARVSSGVTAATFLKRTAIARADGRAIARMAPSVIALADHEGFPAHAQAVRERTR
ncbi:MAG: histidinol dehydrogenase, partial [Actinomycetota bacterium]|nr:histidinol dehydrogenase [Actinomycetota bacterium]